MRSIPIGRQMTIDGIRVRPHSVGEAALWIRMSGRRLVRTADGRYRIVARDAVTPGDRVPPDDLVSHRVEARDNGAYSFGVIGGEPNLSIYECGNWRENETAMREERPAMYESFRCPRCD